MNKIKIMKFNLLFLIVLILVAGFFAPVSAEAASGVFVANVKGDYEIFLAPEKPESGQALVIALRLAAEGNAQPTSPPLNVTFLKHSFQLEAIAGGWRGVIAVPLGTATGTYDLLIRSADGAELKLPVVVSSHDYGEQRLSVKKEMATPMRPENLKKIKQNRRDLKIAYGASKAQLLLTDKLSPPLTSRLTSPFGTRRLLNGKPKSPHGGVDFKAAIGVSVPAAARGRVVLAEELYYSGKIVIIDHGLSIFTLYMHLSKIDCQVGAVVGAGEVIGKSGKSGRVTGPHLHWGVKIAGVFVDPLRFVEDSKHLLEIPWEVGDGKGKF